MPQAMVDSGRKCPPRRNVIAPRNSATAPVAANDSTNPAMAVSPSAVVTYAVA